MHRNPVCEGVTEALDNPHLTARQPVVTETLPG